MDKRAAIRLVQDTLESAFDKSKFAYLVRNMLDRIEDAPFIYRGNFIPDAYKPYISTLERIGKYKDREGNKIDLLIVRLKKETSLERARTMQRNFIAWYLNGSRGGVLKDAALAAFVSPDTEDWRFSLVKMDYRLDTSGEKVKVKKELTPARRFSFLVGKNENSHTAQSCLLPVLEKKVQDPTLIEIEQAFDIETVTKEFFLKYRELFLHTKEELDRVVKKDPKIKADFEAKGVDTVNFAKKLLGQIIFLYFLQKKGWFGVGRDNDWGTGSKHFLRELFEKKHADYNNFFNDILEPLFYEALRTGEDRKHEDYYYSRFNCKIPFLNGGLFDPIGGNGGYDWVHTDILIPDKLFSNNVKTKEGDTGTGILDVFDRYNFTAKEDEPLEKEVAIDPELLGKSYEKFNAIRPDNFAEFKKALKSGKKGEENKFNKKFGVYYTPREIVHYMCQQSLINYLHTEVIASKAKQSLIPSKKDIEALIHIGEQVSENEAIFLEKERKIKKGEQKTTSIKSTLPDSIRKNAKLIDDKLAEITVCDPAVGSGAFPVGMMTEIVKARMFFVETGCLEKIYINSHHEKVKRTPYNFKRDCIEYSLYGVDIDPGAVEIAKLRLWLSLVVDEQNIKNIKPLPNLDYRIMQGNSLISEFMGINFDDDEHKNLKRNIEDLDIEIKGLGKESSDKQSEFSRYYNKTRKQDQNLLNKINELADIINNLKKKRTQLIKKLNNPQDDDSGIIDIISEFQKKKNNFLNESNVTRKSKLKNEVDDLLVKMFEVKMRTQKEDYFNRLKNIENKYSVLRNEKQRDELIKQDKTKLYKETGFDLESAEKQLKEFTSGKKIKPFFLWNLYFSEIFHHKGGFDVVIANPPWVQSKVLPKEVKKQFLNKYKTAIGQFDLFNLFIERSIELLDLGGCLTFITPDRFITNIDYKNVREYLLKNTFIDEITSLGDDIFDNVAMPSAILITENLKQNNEKVKCRSYFSSDFEFKRQKAFLRNEGCIFKIFGNKKIDGLLELISSKSVKLNEHLTNARGVEIGKDSEAIQFDMREGLKKFLRGKDIERYRIKSSVFLDTFYADIDYKEDSLYRGTKILIRKTGNGINAVIDEEYRYAIQVIYIFKKKPSSNLNERFILANLNSKLMAFCYSYTFGEKDRKTFPHLTQGKILLLPIIEADSQIQKPFIELVDKILYLTHTEDYMQNPQKQAKVKALEAEIDQLVYKLYDLTPEEIKIVEGENVNRNRRN